MARISELHYSNAFARSTGIDEFLEVSLSQAEEANEDDFVVGFYQADGSFGIEISLTDAGVRKSFDADAKEWVYVISADTFPILLTDPDGGGSTNYEAYALVDSSTSTVIDFYDIGGGTQNITASGGPADGATSTNLPVPTDPNSATYSIQFNQPNPGTQSNEPISEGASGSVCFAAGTRIETPHGPRPIEDLRPGDLVLTLDAGPQAVVWAGCTRMVASGRTRPVRIAPGVLGNTSALVVSPQHRLLLRGPRAMLLFGTAELLVPARALVDGRAARRIAAGPVDYHHILLEQHHVVRANGVAAETFLPGRTGLDVMDAALRETLLAIRPDLRAMPESYGPAARPLLQPREYRLLAA
ncbi:Hint domain-containing protein [Pontivivens ytuae]|uniref:Hint domain-containing protein n=1 Tax=Pontivivens ytuae TaxID=2789856 RepID=A0A7S9QB50_9RHOB|nr:Hint domain-containing protein [Pontivivens ytuae]QPH52803.1 Hint domain-containing protein [Pontivivens ytuae]